MTRIRLAASTFLVILLTSCAAFAATAGPDQFGYVWKDSDESGVDASIPDYTPMDLRPLGLKSDDTIIHLTLPAPFPFYGTKYTDLWVSSNGWVALVDSAGSFPIGMPIPSLSLPNALVAFYWEDCTLDFPGTPATYAGPTLDGDGYVVDIRLAPWPIPIDPVRVVTVLYDDGRIKVIYDNGPFATQVPTSAGIEDATGSIGLAYIAAHVPVNGAVFRAGYAVCYLPPTGAASECTSCPVPAPTPPSLANTLRAVRQNGDVGLSWASPGGSGLAGFRLYRHVGKDLDPAARSLVAQTPVAVAVASDKGAIGAPPLVAYYQAVGLSCAGIEGPY